ncbi:MAG TPA: response regulator [Polyangiaceae bacterium]|jgi:two-component system cell cycle response regulator|nr:response regulator [Polyangiaceae bacterium]
MATGPPTILLADDEYAALEVLELLLRGEGFDVVTASDGVEALEVVAARQVDLVITDFKMPRMDGVELCARLQADPRSSSIPILMTSATYVLEKTPPPGVVAFIPKPIRWPVLLEKVRSTLAARPG